ncbi:MAG: uracil-DNA glycosylase [Thermodesulfobacteriota bacterium]
MDCRKCRHFYITWDEKAPRGCRAMGFKTREMPSSVVRQASGRECLAFERKVERRR